MGQERPKRVPLSYYSPLYLFLEIMVHSWCVHRYQNRLCSLPKDKWLPLYQGPSPSRGLHRWHIPWKANVTVCLACRSACHGENLIWTKNNCGSWQVHKEASYNTKQGLPRTSPWKEGTPSSNKKLREKMRTAAPQQTWHSCLNMRLQTTKPSMRLELARLISYPSMQCANVCVCMHT